MSSKTQWSSSTSPLFEHFWLLTPFAEAFLRASPCCSRKQIMVGQLLMSHMSGPDRRARWLTHTLVIKPCMSCCALLCTTRPMCPTTHPCQGCCMLVSSLLYAAHCTHGGCTLPITVHGQFCKPYSVAHVQHGWTVAHLTMCVGHECGNVFFETQLLIDGQFANHIQLLT